MRIACPSCAAEYDVPAARLPPHKMVRCARCGGEWEPEHQAEAAAAEPAADHPTSDPEEPRSVPMPAVLAIDRPAASPATQGMSVGLGGAWILTVVVLVGAVAATVVWRDQVMRVWPPSARILAPFGHMLPQPGQTEGTKAK